LLTYDGWSHAAFTTAECQTVVVPLPVARLLDSVICALGDLTDDVLDLLDVTEAAVSTDRSSAKEKKAARAALKKAIPMLERQVNDLRDDLPQMFEHYYKSHPLDDEITGNA
jgi:hypothetical protein